MTGKIVYKKNLLMLLLMITAVLGMNSCGTSDDGTLVKAAESAMASPMRSFRWTTVSAPSFKEAGLLTRDPRMKERKKYGLKAARRAPQYSKR